MRMRILFPVLMMILLSISGCGNLLRKTDPPPPPEPIGPQSKAEVLALISPTIQPLRNTLAPTMPGLSVVDRERMMSELRNAVVNYGATDFGKQALRDVGYEIMEIARKAAEQKRFKLVMTCIDATELLAMESHLLKRLGSRADVMLERPAVRVRGFLDDHEKGDTYVFLDLINRQNGAVDKIEARVGDEFNQLRLVQIMGRNKAVLLEYLRVPGLVFEVEAF